MGKVILTFGDIKIEINKQKVKMDKQNGCIFLLKMMTC